MLERLLSLRQKFVGGEVVVQPSDRPRNVESGSAKSPTNGNPPVANDFKPRKKRKAQEIFGRVVWNNNWFEQRSDGVYVRRRYGRKWKRVSFETILDEACGQLRLPPV